MRSFGLSKNIHIFARELIGFSEKIFEDVYQAAVLIPDLYILKKSIPKNEGVLNSSTVIYKGIGRRSTKKLCQNLLTFAQKIKSNN